MHCVGIKTMRVVAGVLRSANQVCVACRPSGKSFEGCWEFPGGKVEDTDVDENRALERELFEELGINTQPPYKKICTVSFNSIDVVVYNITNWIGTPKGMETQDVEWMQLSTLQHLPMTPATRSALRILGQGVRFAK